MPTNTYIPISTITLSSSASEIIFSNIPANLGGQNFKDLVINITGTLNVSAGIEVTINGDTTASNYSFLAMEGLGSGSGSSYTATSNSSMFVLGDTTSHAQVVFMDYTATDKHKTYLASSNFWGLAEAYVQRRVGRWASTSVIVGFRLYDAGGRTFNSGTTVSIFGVAG